MKKKEKEMLKETVLHLIQTGIDMAIRARRYDEVYKYELQRAKFLIDYNK